MTQPMCTHFDFGTCRNLGWFLTDGPTSDEMKLFNETVLPWAEAQAFCEAIGGHLPTVLTLDLNQQIYDTLPDQTKPRWLGASRTDGDQPFFWTTGEQESLAAGFANNGCTEGVDCLWLFEEPNDFGGDENCLSMGHPTLINSDNNFRGGWNDAVCSSPRIFLCTRNGEFVIDFASGYLAYVME